MGNLQSERTLCRICKRRLMSNRLFAFVMSKACGRADEKGVLQVL
jgi:hypothetical protein